MSKLKFAIMKLAARSARNKDIKRIKKNFKTKGELFMLPREGKKPVMTYLCRPQESSGKLPVVFNVHGGAWVGGDALLLDTQSQNMAERLGALVVNINYVKADIRPFPYAQYEVYDTVKYFAAHSEEYGIDTDRFALMGYSAGGHLCACAAQLLAQEDFKLSCQVLCYPFLDFTFGEKDEQKDDFSKGLKGVDDVFFPGMKKDDFLVSPGAAPDELFCKLPETVIITCGEDVLKPQADSYKQRLDNHSIKNVMLDYPDSIHGFLECNYPETEDKSMAKSPELEIVCRKCEQDIAEYLRRIWS